MIGGAGGTIRSAPSACKTAAPDEVDQQNQEEGDESEKAERDDQGATSPVVRLRSPQDDGADDHVNGENEEDAAPTHEPAQQSPLEHAVLHKDCQDGDGGQDDERARDPVGRVQQW